MADRPQRPGSAPDDPSGTPDYDWIYGGNQTAPDPTRPVPKSGRRPPSRRGSSEQEHPEATQMMPTMPPPGSGGSTPRSARSNAPAGQRAIPSPGQIAPTPGAGKGGSGPRGRGGARGWLRPRRILLILLVLVLIWIGAIIWAGLAFPHSMNHVAYEPSGTRPADQPGTTYLVVASDSRKGLSKAERKKLHTGGDVGQRTDTIKLLHTGSGKSILLTIPRDSYVPIPGHGSTKINAAFSYGGPKLLVKTIEQDTGIRIDGYVEIGMGGLVNLVDGVGGITICPKTRMDDKLANLHVKKGCQPADGVTALAYSRSRHAQQLGDLGRGEAQNEVISQIGKKVAGPGTLLNPFKLHSLSDAASGISVGKGMSTLQIARFALAFRGVAGGDALKCGVPISDMYIHWDEARSKQMFSYIKKDKTDDIPKSLCTPSGLPKSVTG